MLPNGRQVVTVGVLGDCPAGASGVAEPTVGNARFPIDDRIGEVIGDKVTEDLLGRLGVADDQPAVVVQGRMELVHNLAHGLGRKVDQHIAAEDQVHVGRIGEQRRIARVDQVQVGKSHLAANALMEHGLASILAKIVALDVRRHLAKGPGPIRRPAGLVPSQPG